MRDREFKFSDGGTSVMQIRAWFIILATVLALAGASVATAQTSPPALFFTDLTAGPNTGNTDTAFTSSGNGAYVTLYGNNLGTVLGSSTVTWNGQNCLTVIPATGNYTGWGSAHLWYQKIIVQVMSTCTPGTGNFVATTASGTSNGIPFTVRALGANHIYRAASSGGTHATVISCRDALTAGDICYVKNLNQTSPSGFSAMDLGAQRGTSWTSPVSLVVYPGATSVIGGDSIDKGIEQCNGYTPQCPGSGDHFIILAGFEVHGQTYAISIQGAQVRYVAERATCPNATKTPDMPGCFNTINNFETLLGNEVYNVGFNRLPDNAGKYQHSFYIGAGHDFEIGWNYSHDGNGGRLTQFYNGTSASYNIGFHDNVLLRNVNVDCVTFDVNPGLGAGGVKIYNNVVGTCGKAPAQGADFGGSTCMYFQSSGGTPTVAAQAYNNTLYDCGATAAPFVKGAVNPGVKVDWHDNIIYQTSASLPYLASGGGPASNVTGSNNVWSGAGNGPAQTTGNINADPLFVATGSNFKLQAGSPALGAGVSSWTAGATSAFDVAGLVRPTPPSIGAYELTSGPPPTKPSPPTNLSIVVN